MAKSYYHCVNFLIMRFLLGSTAIFIWVATAFFGGSMASCTKDHTVYDTVTVIQKDTFLVKDTVIIKDSMFSEELLTAAPWKTWELRGVYGGDSIYFLRGGSNNTTGFGDRSIETYTFYPDGTGLLLDAANATHPIADWKFTNAEKTKLTLLLHATPSTSSVAHFVTWEHIRYKDGRIYTDEYYYDNYVFKQYHGQAIRYQSK